jgi:hypothetical protein
MILNYSVSHINIRHIVPDLPNSITKALILLNLFGQAYSHDGFYLVASLRQKIKRSVSARTRGIMLSSI